MFNWFRKKKPPEIPEEVSVSPDKGLSLREQLKFMASRIQNHQDFEVFLLMVENYVELPVKVSFPDVDWPTGYIIDIRIGSIRHQYHESPPPHYSTSRVSYEIHESRKGYFQSVARHVLATLWDAEEPYRWKTQWTLLSLTGDNHA